MYVLAVEVDNSLFQLVDEFLGGQRVAMAPQTFHMGSLLQEMREIEGAEQHFVPQRGTVLSIK